MNITFEWRPETGLTVLLALLKPSICNCRDKRTARSSPREGGEPPPFPTAERPSIGERFLVKRAE
jgi:hypothetical protein